MTSAWTVRAPEGLTKVLVSSSRGQKYVVLADELGSLHLLAANGTTLGVTPATNEEGGILDLSYITQLLFRSGTQFGIFSPDEQTAYRPCPPFEDLTSVIQGVGPGSKVFVHADGA